MRALSPQKGPAIGRFWLRLLSPWALSSPTVSLSWIYTTSFDIVRSVANMDLFLICWALEHNRSTSMMTPSRHPHRNRKRWQQIQTHDRFCKLVGPTVLSHPLAWQRRTCTEALPDSPSASPRVAGSSWYPVTTCSNCCSTTRNFLRWYLFLLEKNLPNRHGTFNPRPRLSGQEAYLGSEPPQNVEWQQGAPSESWPFISVGDTKDEKYVKKALESQEAQARFVFALLDGVAIR